MFRLFWNGRERFDETISTVGHDLETGLIPERGR